MRKAKNILMFSLKFINSNDLLVFTMTVNDNYKLPICSKNACFDALI